MGMEGCGLPIIVHGDLKINQSFAYGVANLGPKYEGPPSQRAVDDMFQGALEDCMASLPVSFSVV